MSELQAGVRRLERLQQTLGRDVELVDEDGTTETYRLLAEFTVNGSVYAALQTPAMRKEDEIALFRVDEQDGELSLSSIDDEDEWETAAEGYDELLFEETNG